MNQPRRSSGRLFPKAPEGNKPTWTGDLTLTPELIQEINQLASRGGVRLRLACWPKQSQRPGGGEYLSVSAEMDKIQPGDQQQGGFQQQPRSGYQPRQYTGGGQRVQGGGVPVANQRVDRPGFQPPQRPARQLPPEGQEYPFDDEIPFGGPNDGSAPWRR